MKVTTFSDTHQQHDKVKIEPCDLLAFCGDSTNYKELHKNEQEFKLFVDWFELQPAKYKVMIAGNHDGSLLKKYNKELLKEKGIIYLEHEYVEIEGRKIFGSPYTPTYGNWSFMISREKLGRYWDVLEEGIDLLITHGPPKGILDLSEKFDRTIEFCGDSALMKAVNKVKPKYHSFGHIHNGHGIINYGYRIIDGTTFINCSIVEDGKFLNGPINYPISFYL